MEVSDKMKKNTEISHTLNTKIDYLKDKSTRGYGRFGQLWGKIVSLHKGVKLESGKK